MRAYIQIAIRTNSETIGWGVGSRLFDSLSSNGGLLAPEFVSHNADKVTEIFDGQKKMERFWAEKASIQANGTISDFFLDFAWKKESFLKSSGRVSHTFRNLKNQIVPGDICLKSEYGDKINWYGLFKNWCDIFPPQLGMLHLFSDPELGPHERRNSFQIGSFNAALKPDIPNIGWAMFYGNEFAEKIDAEGIFRAGFPIEKMSNGYLVRVTEDIKDIARDFEFFARQRTELRSLFPSGFFLE